MGKLVGLLLLVVLGIFMTHRWMTLENMGERRSIRLAQPGNEVVVGISWPFSEEHDGFADGLRLAQQEINEQGGMQLRLVLRNSAGGWSQERKVALEFARDPDMSAVIGYREDSHAISASALYEGSRLLHLVAGSTSTALTDHGNPYVVHTLVTADKVARSLAHLDTGPRYALVWEKDGEWDSLVAEYRVEQEARGASNSYQLAYSRGQADFRQAVNELKTRDADVILFVGHENEAANFLERANAIGLPQTIVCACLATPQLKTLAGLGRGRTMLLDFYNEYSGDPANQKFVARYLAHYGRLPDTWAAQAYDALRLLAEAVHTSKSRGSEDLALALRYLPTWEGANGKYKFDANGEIAGKPVFLKRYRNGGVVEVITLRDSKKERP